MKFGASRRQPWSWGVALGALGLIIVTLPKLDAQGQKRGGRGQAGKASFFVIKQHLDQTAGLAYYIRKLYPDNAAGPTVQDQSREDSGAPAAFGKQSLES
jgi:hypothetical protein